MDIATRTTLTTTIDAINAIFESSLTSSLVELVVSVVVVVFDGVLYSVDGIFFVEIKSFIMLFLTNFNGSFL